MVKSIAIKEIATFLYASGDLTSELFMNKRSADGTKAHQLLQKEYNEDSKKEVYVKFNYHYLDNSILIHGFIDGVLTIDNEIILEEIKSTRSIFDQEAKYHKPAHLAQLKLYAYVYCYNNNLTTIKTRLTYINITTSEVRYIYETYDVSLLEEFFNNSLEVYLDWTNKIINKDNLKLESIKEMTFPFNNERLGQRDMMKGVYHALVNNDIIYINAPTGIGKTMAALFPAIKSISKENEKIFYLTAKGTGKNIAVDAIRKLMNAKLKIKTLVLTSKSKSCLLKTNRCDPKECIYAKGFFDKLNKATSEIFDQVDVYDYNIINEYSQKHEICSFEFSLYLSYFCDIIIADYNYAFDPKAHLIRYFDDDTYKVKLLIDEAHNLVSRSKDMYSTSFVLSDILTLKKLLIDIKPRVSKEIDSLFEHLTTYFDKASKEYNYCVDMYDQDMCNKIKNLCLKCEDVFLENENFPNRYESLEIYFRLKDFIAICEIFSLSHRFIVKEIENDYEFSLVCLDASKFLLEIIKRSSMGAAFFSATLTPIKYHMDLLSASVGKHIILDSPYDKGNLNLIINDKISTRFKNREHSVDEVIKIIIAMASSKLGNYIVFFPSYKYLNMIYEKLVEYDYELIIQKPNMSDYERDYTFRLFKDNSKTQIGLFVMGGVFSEGLDYIGDLLSGVCIVGVGLPMVNYENDMLKSYFETQELNGFDYAYTIPGFIKVVQAAGRVIRSETDKGLVILIDERFRYKTYLSLMPNYWSNKKTLNNIETLKNELKRFWNK